MMNENLTGSDLIAVSEARSKIQNLPPNATLEDKLRAAMRSTRHNWLVGGRGDKSQQLRLACAAVCLEVGLDSPEGQQVANEHKALSILSQSMELMAMGVNVDFMEATKNLMGKPIGLVKLWHEVK